MKKHLLILFFLPILAFAQTPPADYYSGTENLSGYALKSKLHDIISTKVYTYNYDDLKTTVNQTDLDKYYENDGTILDIYSEIPTGPDAYNYTSANIIGSASAEGQGWNREHMMPQSSFNSAYPMYADLFFVVPTDARINQLRSDYPYAKAGSSIYYTFTNGSKQALNGTANATYTGRVFEPIDEFKGDVARTLLYFVVRYEGKLRNFKFTTNIDPTKDVNPLDGTEEKAYENWYIAMLLLWNQQDHVSQREIDRNNTVFSLQKNRNPFIDHPEWIDAIWNQTSDNVAPSAPSSLLLARNSAYFVDLNWQSSPESDVIGYHIYQDNVLVASSKTSSLSIDHLMPNTNYNFTVKAYDNAYLESPQSNILNVTTLANDVFANDLQIVKYLEGSGNNKALEIANRTGHKVNLNSYKLNIQYKGTVYYFAEPFELEGELENNKSLVAINSKANFSCFNNADARFVIAAPSLTFSGSNYVDLSYKATSVDAIGTKDIDNGNANKSLYRNPIAINPTATFDLAEWTAYASDYCLNLGVLGLNESSANAADFRIYPNPVNEVLNVEGDLRKAKSAKIYDVSGKLIKELNKPFVNGSSLNVRSLLPNTYILNIDGNATKFIKH
ncbi:MAG: endonuclease [Weeksellaceae bacterium]|nr:endonuclease [Weeksellaceae bacterium]